MSNDNLMNRLHISAILPAPVKLVWQLWTTAEHITNWWGPTGFINTIHSMDLTAGGEWRLTMHGPDGKKYPNKSIFIEIVKLKKIVYHHFKPNYIATVIFTPEGKETLLEWTMQFETTALFETVVKVFKADEGLKQNVEKLIA